MKIDLVALRRNLDLLRLGGSDTFLCHIHHAEALVRLAEAEVVWQSTREACLKYGEALHGEAKTKAWRELHAALSPFLPGKGGA